MPLSTSDSTNETAKTLFTTLRGVFHTPDSMRPAHARGILLSGTFTPTSEAATLSKAHHFNASSTPVLVRFSNSTGIPTIPDNDANANPRGMATRFQLPSADGKRQHTDIIAHSTRYFPKRTGEGFLEMLGAIGNGTIGDYLGQNPSAATFVQDPKPMPSSFGTEKFFGVNAFKAISADGKETFIRYRIKPVAGESHLSDEEAKSKDPAYLHNEIQARVIDGPVSFTLNAQIAEEGDVTDDATVIWPDERKVVELGTIKIEKVEDENDEKQRTIIFDPVPRVEGLAPSDDPLLDMRASIYLQSGKIRRAAKPE
jgi:catalase